MLVFCLYNVNYIWYKYKIDEKIAIEKKIKPYQNKPIQIKMEKGNNLRVYCSAVAFEGVRELLEKKQTRNKLYNKSNTN